MAKQVAKWMCSAWLNSRVVACDRFYNLGRTNTGLSGLFELMAKRPRSTNDAACSWLNGVV